jgi:hypothetical protein
MLTAMRRNPCEFSADAIIVYDRNFAGSFAYIYFSLVLTIGLQTLNAQFIKDTCEYLKSAPVYPDAKIYGSNG